MSDVFTLRRGRPEPPPAARTLRAGPLTLVFEEQSGWVRRVRLGEREIVRAIYAAVRDKDWGTVEPRLSNVNVREEPDGSGFSVSFDATCQDPASGIDFAWHGAITGARDATLIYTFDGAAQTAFLRNRIGLCVLHPDGECAGHPVTVEHADGSVEHGAFPERIAPHQPFFNIRAVRHSVRPGSDLQAEVRFNGDVFEMEDQRNWTDASFKTYGTPLALPYPVDVAAGERVLQQVTLTLLRGNVPQEFARWRRPAPEVTLTLAGDARPLPLLGLCLTQTISDLDNNARLRALRLSHLRVDLDLSAPEAQIAEVLETGASQAAALDVRIEAALAFPNDLVQIETRLRLLGALMKDLRPDVCRWLVIYNKAERLASWFPFARLHLDHFAPGARMQVGTDANFAELNRERPAPNARIDGAFFALNPQVHAFDDQSLMENLAPQAETVRGARAFVGNGFLAVSPVTLTPRGGANGFPGPENDPRLASLLAAAWTLGSIRYLADAGANSITYFAAYGGPHALSRGAHVLPPYHVLADVGEFAAGQVIPLASSDPLRSLGFTLEKNGRRRTLAANVSPDPQRVRVQAAANDPTATLHLSRLDETTAALAMSDPEGFRARPGERVAAGPDGFVTLDLLPYAVARLDQAQTP